ncbi:MAG TPA: cofactor-independent phosphoglycerate mutase [Candidatus Sumerlaeota bacterium]|nr:MAG: cofactor-independent phosphoglycerate mutase [candidate division BRC1 bacterium ADurb.Bin183]HOE64080.1 cofactor-independent phosphoglycerate mutase [Candidatus Sumerlaeota bacterium]HRR30540.1 cofactor-independent phosphoglycerate mutase [Candidatus Sumerlaeia bacterium]HON49023.1 cofactor-independent phosphoglycerate mutase [Candidatus Sumerlaeota bacterium]HOR64369.1 cofactor-independent phosphoglycerate mutase [Candidatus Sumerlaeota bacterium]
MKYIIFLGDGMADEPIESLGGKTPLQAALKPNMDKIAREGLSGSFLTLPDGFPTSSDVANLSVLGYDLATCYTGRGPLEAGAQGIDLAPNQIALRCNLITVLDGVIEDYSGGHISNEDAAELMNAMQEKFGSDKVRFYPGVSYRNLLILTGDEFSADLDYAKPDSSHGLKYAEILISPKNPAATYTADFVNNLTMRSKDILESHPVNLRRKAKGELPANLIWPWSPGGKPALIPFEEKYGKKGAVISAVDVIFGIAHFAGMERIKVAGATGFVDTNYEGKAEAAIKALEKNDFVYLHVEAIDEVGHMGDLPLKIKTIEDFDRRCVGHFMNNFKGSFRAAILPDHPVPVKKRKHTRTPVPVSLCGPGINRDEVQTYDEAACPKGALGLLKGDELMKKLFE